MDGNYLASSGLLARIVGRGNRNIKGSDRSETSVTDPIRSNHYDEKYKP